MTHVMIKHALCTGPLLEQKCNRPAWGGGDTQVWFWWGRAAGNLKVKAYIYLFSKETVCTHLPIGPILDQILTKIT